MRWRMVFAWVGACALVAGCAGVIEEPSGDEKRAGDGSGVSPRQDGLCEVDAPRQRLQRLTREQYDRTVRDLLGVDLRPARDFAADETTDGFEVGVSVSPLLAEQYLDAAEELAGAARERLDEIVPCDPEAMGQRACGSAFIAEFAPRAWRRPLTDDEVARFEALFEGALEEGFDSAIELVIHAALASPNFLYHLEPVLDASPGELVPVTGYAMANRLSYLLWNSMPDEALFEAAATGLETPQEVEAQARRMLDDPRAAEGLANFTRQWLGLDAIPRLEKADEVAPDFDADVARDLRASLEAYLDHVVWEEGGSVADLLLGDTMFVTPTLAGFYGLESPEEGLAAITVEDPNRQGLLTQPGLLALLAKPNQSDPVHRGLFVRERLLCQHLPPPPDDIVVRAPDPAPGLTTRERFAEHSANPTCAGCHRLIDPIGFGFEAYDALGRFRETEEGQPVDTTGEVVAAEDADGPFDGVAELSAQLAESDVVRQCMARQLFRYSVGRTETEQDACSLERIYEAGAESGWEVREMLIALTQTDAFLNRRVPEGGAL